MAIVVNKSNYLFAALAGLFISFLAAAAITDEYLLLVAPFTLLIFYLGWQNKNTVFFLLLAALPFSFGYNFSPELGTDIPDEFLMLLTAILFFAYWIYSPRVISKNVLQHPILILLLAALCWTVVTVAFSSNQTVSIKYLLAKGWYIGAFVIAPLIVFNNRKSIITAMVVLASSMLLVVAISLVRHYKDGFSFATVNDAVEPFFRNHVNYSAMLVCIVPILFAFYKFAKTRNLKLFIAALIVVALVALFYSYARGAWLALLVGAIAWWLIKKRLLFYSYIAAVIITISLLFWIKGNDRYLQYAHDYKTTIFHKNFSEHLISTYKLKDVSTAERFYRWIAGVRMIKDNWLTGYGPNTFYDNYKGYAVPAYKTWVSDNAEHSTVHNYFLLIAIEQGIPGLIFFLLLLGAMFYYSQHLYTRIADPFYKSVALVTGVIFTMIMAVNFWSDLIETDKVGSLFFLCLATLVVIDVKNRKKRCDSKGIEDVN